jgi:hypothetical protein
MDRVDSNNAVLSPPAFSEPETAPGYFNDLTPDSNGTVVPAWWLNAVQEEILSVVLAAGITPNRAQWTQLNAAIAMLIANHASVTYAGARADAAYERAGEALNKATDNAADIADLEDDVGETVEKVDGFQDQMDGLNTAMGTVQSTVSGFGNTIVAISTKADQAIGLFKPPAPPEGEEPTVFNVNDLWKEPDKLFISDNTTIGLPSQLTFPVYLEVMTSEDETTATQNAWDLTANHMFSRCATINASDPDSPVVTWTPWNSIAVPEIVKSVDIVDNPSGQPSGKYLIITMETENGDTPVYINLSQLIDVYTSGNGAISVSSNNEISLILDSTNASGLFITEDGLGLILPAIPAAGSTVSTQNFGDAGSAGSAATWSKSDHKHAMPAAPTIPAAGTTASTQNFGDAASGGTASTWSKSDHKHAMPSDSGLEKTTNKTTSLASSVANASDTKYPSEKAVVSALVSISGDIPEIPDVSAKQDKIPAGTSGNVLTYSGVAGTVGSLGFDSAPTANSVNLIKSGAVKTAIDAIPSAPSAGSTVTTQAFGDAGAAGSATTWSKSDHKHGMPSAPDISGKQDKVAAGTTAGHPILDTTTAGSVGKTTGTLAIQSGLTVGNSSYAGAVTVRSAGSSATTIVGPNNGTATLPAGTLQTQIVAGTSGNVVTYSGTAGSVGSLGFDSTPTANSTNLVNSGAIKAAISTNDYQLMPISFDTAISSKIKTFLPADYPYVQIVGMETNGTVATLTINKSYTTGSTNITTTKANISGFVGIGVNFTVAITGGTEADFLLKFSKE